ncbi:hypothetical protein BC008_22100 [Mastigocoleus testarum BC008]|uniref:Uncharacterized protein n=1 Tax=Mastigocoleus testarum BC008 TaxID=371196 RepID=A0A0V7ZMK5_9CYAN|nr:hypothetical protein BC008_22100 [Mastigocoleus testarum BC008]
MKRLLIAGLLLSTFFVVGNEKVEAHRKKDRFGIPLPHIHRPKPRPSCVRSATRKTYKFTIHNDTHRLAEFSFFTYRRRKYYIEPRSSIKITMKMPNTKYNRCGQAVGTDVFPMVYFRVYQNTLHNQQWTTKTSWESLYIDRYKTFRFGLRRGRYNIYPTESR